MNKNTIKKFAIEARKKLIDSVTDKAGILGITEKSCSEPITKGPDFEIYQTIAGTEVTLNKNQCEQRKKLDMRLNVNGVMTKNFGYRVLCINKKAALITFIGEKNPDFDITKAGVQKLSDADAKQMALDMDKNSYKAEKQTVSRYFDMQELKQKCEVETTYIDNGGATFVTAHAFDAE